MRRTKHRTETRGGKGATHSGTKKKEKPLLNPVTKTGILSLTSMFPNKKTSSIETSQTGSGYANTHVDAMCLSAKISQMTTALIGLINYATRKDWKYI